MSQETPSSAQRALNSAFYGMLNVIDPSVAYDANGKVIAAWKPPSEEENKEVAHRNPFNSCNPSRALIEPLLDDERQDDLDMDVFHELSTTSQTHIVQQSHFRNSRPKVEPAGSKDESSDKMDALLMTPIQNKDTKKDAEKLLPQTNIKPKELDLCELVLGDEATKKAKLMKQSSKLESTSGQEMTLEEVEATIVIDPSSEVVEVVDYKVSTPLFKAMERKDWHAVLYYIRTGSFSYSPIASTKEKMESIEAQARTWVSKMDGEMELWCQLPLHVAICLGAPQKVIEMLILANPDALQCPDSHGNLPLHLAYIFDADVNVTALIVSSFPGALTLNNNENLQPIQCSSEVKSKAFQSKTDLFSAMSDYSRAVAEQDPDELTHQLQDVQRQLKVINDTIFVSQPERSAEAIKLYHNGKLLVSGTKAKATEEMNQHLATIEERDLGFMERTLNFNFCRIHPETDVIDVTEVAESVSGKMITKAKVEDVPIPVRVKEYCPRTKKWREV